jgi:hypothetical protein
MFRTLTSENKHYLSLFCLVARITGWMLILLGGPWLLLKTVSLVTRIGNWKQLKDAWDNIPSSLFELVVFGVVALGISELIRYLTEEGYRPGWVLRQGDKILYFYALCVFMNSTLLFLVFFPAIPQVYLRIIAVILLMLITAGKILVLVGLGQILRRVMPVIEETKTLV